MARVLVAGFGYLGKALGHLLVEEGHNVFGLRRKIDNSSKIFQISADVSDSSSLKNLPSNLDFVFFTATPDASDEKAYRELYVKGLRNLSEALAPIPILFTSSTSVYGQDSGELICENSVTAPRGFRGQVLLEAESFASSTLRLAGIYGPGRSRSLDVIRSGEATYSPGKILNWIHRDDAAAALSHLMGFFAREQLYIGVDSEPIDSEVFYKWLAKISQSPVPRKGPVAGKNKRLSNLKLKETGFEFKYPTFRDGFQALLSIDE